MPLPKLGARMRPLSNSMAMTKKPDQHATANTMARSIDPPEDLRASGNELADVIGHRETRGQSRRLDAEKVHESRHAVRGRTLDHEVRRGLAGSATLGTYARVAGHQ